MARISRGVLGGFSGSVGPVVGSTWNGIEYIRSKPAVDKDKKVSQKQLEQQAKFATAIRFTRTVHDLLMDTFAKSAHLMTGSNSAISDLLKRAIIGTYPTYDILYSQVMISRGSLPNAPKAEAGSSSAGLIQFNWGIQGHPYRESKAKRSGTTGGVLPGDQLRHLSKRNLPPYHDRYPYCHRFKRQDSPNLADLHFRRQKGYRGQRIYR